VLINATFESCCFNPKYIIEKFDAKIKNATHPIIAAYFPEIILLLLTILSIIIITRTKSTLLITIHTYLVGLLSSIED